MKLQGRDLRQGLSGSDVRLLHGELAQLGLVIPDDETSRSLFGARTAAAVSAFQGEHRIRATGIVDEATARAINDALRALHPAVRTRLSVRGTVRTAEGRPASGVLVRAVDRDLRREAVLGEATTDADGCYEIGYTPEQFAHAGKRRPDLVIRALDASGKVLAATPPRFKAGPTEEAADLIVPAAPRTSEYDALLAELTPALGTLKPADLQDGDLDYLAGTTGIARDQLNPLRDAARLSGAAGVPVEALYGFFRAGLPRDLPSLAANRPAVQRQVLESALDHGTVPPALRTSVDAVINRLQAVRRDQALSRPGSPTQPSLADLLATSANPLLPQLREPFVNAYLEHADAPDELWESLRHRPEFMQGGVLDDLRLTLQLNGTTGGHLPLVRELQALRAAHNLPSLCNLARMTEDDWLALINKPTGRGTVGTPPGTPGEDDAARARTYAETLTQRIAAAFPTAAVAAEAEKAGFPDEGDVVTFFKRTVFHDDSARAGLPDFDLRTTHIDRYLQQNPNASTGIADQSQLAVQLKSMQRVFKLTAHYPEMRALLADGLHSAHSIVRAGHGNFVRRYARRLGGRKRAEEIYDWADRAHALVVGALSRHGGMYEGIGTAVTPKPAMPPADDVANWPQLFGSLSFCACEHCRSVYGPAAYLVDLLSYLGEIKPEYGGESARDILFHRRGDIGEIQLSCANTNTPLPYIDLVNEILEDTVAPPPAGTPRPQTTATAEELAVEPEYVNAAAYSVLRNKAYPWALPFDRWAEEARLYLERLGVKRHELLEIFLPLADPPSQTRAAALDSPAVAREQLGLTEKEWAILTGKAPEPRWHFWGYTGATAPASWPSELAQVPVLLKRSGLIYGELVELLATRFINSHGTVTIGPAESCKPEEMALAPAQAVTADMLDRIVCFVRLRRNLGWSIYDLDRALSALAPGGAPLTDVLLVQLSHVVRLSAALRLPAVGLLSFWSTIDTTSYQVPGGPRSRSLYDRLFQNRAVVPKDELALLQPATAATQPIEPHVPTLSAVIRTAEADLRWLMAKLSLDANSSMSLANLSALYRHVLLAKALNLAVADLLAMKELIGIDPFGHGAADTVLFVEKVQALSSSHFSVAQLNYLYRHDDPDGKLTPSPAALNAVATTLVAGFSRIIAETAPLPPTSDSLATALGQILEPDAAAAAAALIERVAEDTPATRNLVGQYFGTFLANPDYGRLLSVGGAGLTDSQRAAFRTRAISYLLEHLLLYLRASGSRDLTIKTLSETLSLDKQVAEALLERLLRSRAEPGQAALQDFLALAGAGLRAEYAGVDGSGKPIKFTRTDPKLDFAWGAGAPAPGIDPAKGYTVTWRTAVLPGQTETYTFTVCTAGEAKLWLNDVPVSLQLKIKAGQIGEYSTQIQLTAGRLCALRLEYEVAPHSSNAMAQLRWSSLSTPDAVIPQAQLYPDAAFYTRFCATFVLLQKSALLTAMLRLTAKQLEYFSAHQADFAGTDPADPSNAGKAAPFDLNLMPLTPADFRPALFAGWERLRDYVSLRDGFPAAEADLIDVFARANSLADARAALQRVTGWEPAELAALTSADLSNEAALLRLRDQLRLAERTGVPTLKLRAWSQPAPDPDAAQRQAQAIRGALKARYDDQGWQTAAKPLSDRLRERRGAALAGYLASARDLPDTNALYDYLLIDVEMTAIQETSRIKQAISSVQSFVQRCLLGLEKDVEIDEDTAREWKWRKNYRVWEANRKVFLYPENWIEPELRDDKTPFFRELENELLQGDITAAAVEHAYRNYLEKLDAVAKLEVCGMFHEVSMETTQFGIQVALTQQGTPEINVVHMFGRTPGAEPRTYYYRRWIDCSYWTPWEKVGADIQADHLLPVVYKGRLRLFWPVFDEKKQDPAPPYWEIKLAWSEYQDGKWSPKTVSEASISTADGSGLYDKRQYSFSASTKSGIDGQGELTIFCWERFSLEEWGKVDGGPGHLRMRVGYFVFDDYCHVSVRAGGMLRFDTMNQNLYDMWHLVASRLLPPPSGAGPDAEARMHEYQKFVEVGYDPLKFRDYSGTGVFSDYLYTLGETPGQFRIIFPKMYGDLEQAQQKWLDTLNAQAPHSMPPRQAITPFAYQDQSRPFFVSPCLTLQPESGPNWFGAVQPHPVAPYAIAYRFQTFYHPYVCYFMQQLNCHGIDGILDPPYFSALRRQLLSNGYFGGSYSPSSAVSKPYPLDFIDFGADGAYSQYNWELFFHIPLFVAVRLMQNQRFEEARRWFHYIFDPTVGRDLLTGYEAFNIARAWLKTVFGLEIDISAYDAVDLRRFWKTQPFYVNCFDKVSIDQFMRLLADKSNAAATGVRSWLEMQIDRWRKDPFNPHLLARMRITPYQKNVVMKYVDNLIAWGDQLFRQDTMEAINEATQLYILAAEILGPRPTEVTPRSTAPVKTFNELAPDLDHFSNALVQLENLLPDPPWSASWDSPGSKSYKVAAHHMRAAVPNVSVLYFCIPNNEELLGRWDTVADRLFKIRHGMNIEGVVRELALFEPPINPALLVRAAAAGLDIGSVLADLYAPLPHYRFATLLERALELCGDAQALGSALLSALEKRDSEALAATRAVQEIAVLDKMKLVKEAQIDEAQGSIDALDGMKSIATARKQHYTALLEQRASLGTGVVGIPLSIDIRGGLPVNTWEGTGLVLDAGAALGYGIGAVLEATAGVSHALPDESGGTAGQGPYAAVTHGGSHAGHAASAVARGFKDASQVLQMGARLADKVAGFIRRQEEWEFLRGQAELEEKQVQAQIDAAKLRKTALERERDLNDKQLENAAYVRDYLEGKFSNTDLYGWMIGQISAVYFQSYKLAYDTAKQAERCYRFELGVEDSDFIQFGYWDGLSKGLLAGEKLRCDLRRLKLAYADKNRREYELTKHFSLLLHDPLALIRLRETGSCEVDVPEALFDLDFPGHYFRRIKSVRISVPCVVGPYAGVNCTLTLLRNSLRKTATVTDGYARSLENDDSRFVDNLVPLQAIAASSAQNDSGLFELNFHDERYLPFEGAGAISRWRVELPSEFRPFDYETISDVILHINYTAREGGQALADKAASELKAAGDLLLQLGKENGGLYRLFSARHEFPDRWAQFLAQPDAAPSAEIELDLAPARFPFLLRGRSLEIQRIDLYLRLRDGKRPGETQTCADLYWSLYRQSPLPVTVTPPGAAPHAIELSDDSFVRMPHGGISGLQAPPAGTAPWLVQADMRQLRGAVEDLLLVCRYTQQSLT